MMISRQPWSLVCTLAALTAMSSPAWAQPEEAKRHFEAGAARYREGDFAAAAEALQRAYEASPSPQYLFAWAQAERLAKNCEAAVPLYERLLDSELSVEQKALVRDALIECEGQKSGPAPLAPADVAATDPAVPATIVPPAAPAPAPARSENGVAWAPVVIGTAGVATMAVGVSLWDSADLVRDGARGVNADARESRADDRRRTAWIVGGAGAAVTATAVVWWLLSGDDESAVDATARLSPWMGDSVAGVTASATF